MTNDNDARRAHELLDHIANGYKANAEEVDRIRKFLPERPKDVTLDDLLTRVHDAWMKANPSDWGFDTPAEHHDWLFDLRNDLVRILQEQDTPATEPAHPEFLKTAEDYRLAPRDTIVAIAGSHPWIKTNNGMWKTTDFDGMTINLNMSICSRRVLRWGMGDV